MEIESKIETIQYKDITEVQEDIESLSKGYSKYFDIKEKDGHYYIEQNEELIAKRIIKFGTFILITNHPDLSEIEILRMYRRRDAVEKIFDDMKNDLDRKRLRVNRENRVRGSLFITFLSLILLSHIENKIHESVRLKKITKQEIFYELKKIKAMQFNDDFHQINEISRKCKDIFKEFLVPIPGA
jgi:transposase